MHAYLIIAHNNINVLVNLLESIDDEKNNIFIHIDRKANDINFDELSAVCKKSTIIFSNKRYSINWGAQSMVIATFSLLEQAVSFGKHDYYHLISGVDMPLHSQSYMHEFFNKNKGKEFIGFSNLGNPLPRLAYYHLFHEISITNKIINSMRWKLEEVSIMVQKLLKVNRLKNLDWQIKKGPQWFSITHDFAKYVIRNKSKVLKITKFSDCSDEIFMQTLVFNSPFFKNVYNSDEQINDNALCLRLIDWKRGRPYIFTKLDIKELIGSKAMFARKFDEKKDIEIVIMLKKHALNQYTAI